MRVLLRDAYLKANYNGKLLNDRRPGDPDERKMTPHAVRTVRTSIALEYTEARGILAKLRSASARLAINRPDYFRTDYLEPMLWEIAGCRVRIARMRAALAATTVEKYSNLSPSAAKREANRRGSKQ
jgi:hypothetical protein